MLDCQYCVGVAQRARRWRRGPGPAALALGVLLGCGRTVDTAGSTSVLDVGSGADQSRVPPVLVKPGISRYFMVDDAKTGPEMVVFEDPAAPRGVGLGYPGGSYEAGRTAWSPSGRRFAYALTATQVGISPPNHLMLADAADDFAPREVTHEYLNDYAYSLSWVGEHAVLVVTGRRSAGTEGGSRSGRYSLIDADTGEVADLGELPPATSDGMSRDPDTVAVWASQSGAVYLDQSCTVTYVERPTFQNPLFRDCSARAEWSGDGSFVLISTDTERAFYAMGDGSRARATAATSALLPWATAHFSWAPNAPRFVVFHGGGAVDSYITQLAYGDASRAEVVPLTNIPHINYASFLTDDLLVASDWSGDKYVLDVSTVKLGTAAELLPLGLAETPGGVPVATSDSAQLYFPQDPFLEVELSAGRPGQPQWLVDEKRPVGRVQFRLLDSDDAGLLTMVEPERGKDALAYEPHHQYLLGLGAERAVVAIGSFNVAVGTDAQGLRAFQSAPQFGGIFYLGASDGGLYVDWLGFDDITRKLRLVEYQSNVAGLDFPPRVTIE